MKRRGTMSPAGARDALRLCKAPLGGDYHALPSANVAALVEHADERRYRRPANANGSRARYYHDYLQRIAARK